MDDVTASMEVEPPSFQEIDISSTIGGNDPFSAEIPVSEDVSTLQKIELSSSKTEESPSLNDVELPTNYDFKTNSLFDDEVEVSDEIPIPASQSLEMTSSHEVEKPTTIESVVLLPSDKVEEPVINESVEYPSSHEVKEVLTNESVEVSLTHEVDEPVTDVSVKLQPSREVEELDTNEDEVPVTNESVELPSSHEFGEVAIKESEELPSSHEVEELATNEDEVLASNESVELSSSHAFGEVAIKESEELPSSHEVEELATNEDEVLDTNESVELSSSHGVEEVANNESVVLPSSHGIEVLATNDSVELPFREFGEVVTKESEELPSSHDIGGSTVLSETLEVPPSHDTVSASDDSLDENSSSLHPVAILRSESIKENPFNRMSESKSDEKDTASDDKDQVPEDVPKIEDVEVTKPKEKTKEPKSPMVVSVGTIEVNGSNQYEDINIMSKGSSSKKVKPKEPVEEENEENKDYESLRDLRFSSISIYDKPHFEEDIIITVDDAQKHAAESFVSYKVVTKTTRESFLQHEFHVRRRYQDFFWLSNILIQQYSSNIIPPLPQKKMFNKYDPSFLRLRQLALNKFLCRIAEHPILSASEHFFTFLSAKQVELIEQKKTTALKKFSIPQLPITNPESPFKPTSEYIEEFGKILSTLSSQSTKLDKEQSELEDALNILSPSLALWANSEGDLEPTLSKLGDIVSQNSEELGKLVTIKEEIFSEGIKEYQLYINTVKNVLKTRDHMQVTKDYFTETVLSKQKELEKLEASEPGKSFATFFGKSPVQVKEEKMTKLKNDITNLSSNGEAAGDDLVVASASIRSDIERWKINKEKDLRSLLDSVAQSNLTCCNNSTELWESLIQFIDEAES